MPTQEETTSKTQSQETTQTETSSQSTDHETVEEEKKEAPLSVKNPQSAMEELELELTLPPEAGELVEGRVIHIGKTALYLDLDPHGTGIIFGREFLVARDLIKKVSEGDTLGAKVVERENEDGYIELSLKEARQAVLWSEAEELAENRTLLYLPVKDANKGGLLIEWQGLAGFLPASQLKAEHYPHVNDGNKDRVLEELQKLIGTRLPVVIITASAEEQKLIFSEKTQGATTADSESSEAPQVSEKPITKYEVGDVVEGTVTGVVDFGVFVKVEEGLEGLVHISEIDWGLVDDPRNMFTVGESIQAKIIESTDEKISLSIKALKNNPWNEAAGRYQKGDEVTAAVIKFNQHGMLASIEEGVAGLVHVSEFGSIEQMREQYQLGQTYSFTITLFNPDDQKMTLAPLQKEDEGQHESHDAT